MYADQLPLKLGLREAPMFANFFGKNNQALVDYLQKKLLEPGERSIYVWGDSGTGKTYFLHAACYFMQEHHKIFFYLDLQDVQQGSPSILENLETYSLICIDGVELIAGDNSWEEKLFHLYNRAIEKKSLLLFASRKPINGLDIIMPDLTSRLNWGGAFQLKALTDDEKKQVLFIRAKELGLELPSLVIEYILKRYTRDMHKLCELLHKLDRASLSTQRKLTIPFVKEVLS